MPKIKIKLKFRPGWHIEDTAITEHFFGPQYDIHGGARDLIFPHHEAEIAQMESVSGKKPFVKYWLHTGFLNVEGTKMSKSLQNFITIEEVLKHYDYKLLRFFYLNNHYRKPMDYKEGLLDQAKNSLERIQEFYVNAKNKRSPLKKSYLNKTKKQFYSYLDDDFNTPKAFAVLFDFIREANKEGPNHDAYLFLREINTFLDILTEEEKIPEEIINLAKQRLEARKQKDFKKSDELREKIAKKGFLIEDSEDSFKLKKQ